MVICALSVNTIIMYIDPAVNSSYNTDDYKTRHRRLEGYVIQCVLPRQQVNRIHHLFVWHSGFQSS